MRNFADEAIKPNHTARVYQDRFSRQRLNTTNGNVIADIVLEKISEGREAVQHVDANDMTDLFGFRLLGGVLGLPDKNPGILR